MNMSTFAPSPTLRWKPHGEKEDNTYHHQSLPNASRDDDATRHSIYAPSAGYDGEPSHQNRVARDRQHFLIPLLPEVSETRGEATSKQIMDALVTGGKIVVVPSLGSYKLAIVMSDHEERSSKSSVGNDNASTSAATSKIRKVRKMLKTWQRRGSQWVILKRLTLLLVLTVLIITMLAEGFLPLSIVSIPLTVLVLLSRNQKHLHNGDLPKHRGVKNAFGSGQRKCIVVELFFLPLCHNFFFET